MATVKLKLDSILKNRKMTQKELSEITEIREATISVIVRNRVDKINLEHLATIMTKLNITDFNDILEIK